MLRKVKITVMEFEPQIVVCRQPEAFRAPGRGTHMQVLFLQGKDIDILLRDSPIISSPIAQAESNSASGLKKIFLMQWQYFHEENA